MTGIGRLDPLESDGCVLGELDRGRRPDIVGTVDLMGGLAVPDGHPSLLAAVRRPAMVVIAVSSLVLLAFGVRYAGESNARWLDRWALILVRQWLPDRVGAARPIIDLVDPLPAIALVALLTGACLALGRRRLAILAIVGPGLTGVVTTLLKSVIGRTKNGDLAYPSGHMGVATALSLVAALLVVSLIEVRLRTAVAIVAGATLLVAAVIGLAMTVSNYHYVTDAVGGFCAAVALVLGLALVIEQIFGRARSEPI